MTIGNASDVTPVGDNFQDSGLKVPRGAAGGVARRGRHPQDAGGQCPPVSNTGGAIPESSVPYLLRHGIDTVHYHVRLSIPQLIECIKRCDA